MSQDASQLVSPVAKQYLRLSQAKNIGPVCVRKLIDHFGTIEAVFGASIRELERVEGVGRYRAEAIFEARQADDCTREIERATELGVRIICCEDDDYPAILQYIPDPPVCLYMRGQLQSEDGLAVAIVGSRKCSHYGLEQAERFGAALAQAGFTVVSGLARGADAAGHRGALSVGGRTIAVLGCGLAHMYPAEHADLADRIADSGAILSELPIDTSPEAKNFPPRNRIIVGMSMGTLVVEAGKRSGALISARLACEYNREAFALPGLLTNAYAQGSNALIRDGHAKLVTCVEDILDELGEVGELMKPQQVGEQNQPTLFDAPLPPLDDSEQKIWSLISESDTSLEHIVDHSGLAPAQVAATLTKLQLKGIVTQRPGNRFARRMKAAAHHA